MAQHQNPADNVSLFTQLGELIKQEMSRLHVPGVAVGVYDAGQEALAGFGVTSIDHPLSVDADTLFQIGSTTKTITATAVMRLVEAGKLDLEAPLRTYLPDLRLSSEETAAHVTLRHLFTHTGGWEGDYFADRGRGADALARIVDSLVELPQITPLGALWSYNNAGYYLAGRVLEVVTGQEYEAAIKSLVLEPLGMTHSVFYAEDAITERMAIGHHSLGKEQPTIARPWALTRAAHAAGGISSSARDQVRYLRFHLGEGTAADGTQLLSPASLQRMRSPLVQAGNGIEAMGVAWMLRHINETLLVSHGGATNGQLSAFLFVPKRQWGITVLTNADRGGELHQIVTKWALKHYLQLEEPEESVLDLPEEQLATYVGRYSSAVEELEVSMQDGHLLLRAVDKGGFPSKESPPHSPPIEVALGVTGPDRVRVLDEPLKGSRGEFLREAGGKIGWFRLGVRAYPRQEDR